LEAEETDAVGFFIGLGFKIDFLGFGLDFFLGLDWFFLQDLDFNFR
jgi:hypothetical protein